MRASERAEKTEATVNELRTEVHETQEKLAHTSEELTQLISGRLDRSREASKHLFETVRLSPTFDELAIALKEATKSRIISSHGVRTALDHTSLHVRFPTIPSEDDPDSLQILIEEFDTNPVLAIAWDRGMDAVSFSEDLATKLQATEYWQGDQSYEPGQIFEELASTLASGLRALEKGYQHELTQIFERVDNDWFVTERRLTHLDPEYVIPYDRFDEDDWDDHMRGKSWIDVNNYRMAFSVARSLIKKDLFKGRLPKNLR